MPLAPAIAAPDDTVAARPEDELLAVPAGAPAPEDELLAAPAEAFVPDDEADPAAAPELEEELAPCAAELPAPPLRAPSSPTTAGNAVGALAIMTSEALVNHPFFIPIKISTKRKTTRRPCHSLLAFSHDAQRPNFVRQPFDEKTGCCLQRFQINS